MKTPFCSKAAPTDSRTTVIVPEGSSRPITMAGSRLPERGPLWRPQVVPLVVALTALAGGVALQSSVVVAAQESGQLFRCETEEDLDGSACRVDMLPDAALAEMVYER